MRFRGIDIAGGLAVIGVIVLFALTLWPQSSSVTAVTAPAPDDSILAPPTATPTTSPAPEASPQPSPTETPRQEPKEISAERRAEIRVQVLNAGANNGAAGLATGALAEQGFQPLDPIDAVAESAGTQVLNAPGRRVAALTVGRIVGVGPDQVTRADPQDPNWAAFGADLDVLVVIGPPLP